MPASRKKASGKVASYCAADRAGGSGNRAQGDRGSARAFDRAAATDGALGVMVRDDQDQGHLTGEHLPGIAEKALPWSRAIRSIARLDAYDIATVALIAALVVIALCTFKDYAISNDEGVQHHYGELIIAYYRSGFRVRDLFTFQNLYLYGGLFDMIAVALAHVIPVDPYELRHILCAMTGIGGIAASAATARLIAGPRAGLIAAVALALCGAWYGAMFNHTKDIPFAAGHDGGDAVSRPHAPADCRRLASSTWQRSVSSPARRWECEALVCCCLSISVSRSFIYLPWRESGGARLRFAAQLRAEDLPGA